MPKMTSCVDAPIVELVDCRRVNLRGKRKRIAHETILAGGDQGSFPIQAEDLPGAKGEGCDGDESLGSIGFQHLDYRQCVLTKNNKTRPMSSAATDEARGLIDYRFKSRVVSGAGGKSQLGVIKL